MNMLKQRYFAILFLIVTLFFGFTSTKCSVLSEDPKNDWAGSDMLSYTNGEMIQNAADPFVFRDADGTYYLYHTGKGFPVYSSTDLVNWKSQGRSMPAEGYKWGKSKFWAPEVVKLKNKYYLHYSAAGSNGILHIGLAISDSPLGPFTDVNEKPFFETGNKGVLDSDLFFDESGKVYLYYSSAMSTNV
jgi:beta-xylosidase